jgi:DNA-binding NarL/FixJ family response regulator
VTTDQAIRVLLVDDHQMVRQGLIYFLTTQPNIEIAGEAQNGLEAILAADKLKPHVILMDLVMPEMDGLEAIRRIREQNPEIAIIVLSSFIDDNRVITAIQAGAMGYVMKDISPRELATAIRTVANGAVYLQPQAASSLAQGLRTEANPDRPISLASLTDREYEVLCLVARGLSNQEIADQLCITVKTVKAHVSSILSKLNLESRIQAALYALQHKVTCLE